METTCTKCGKPILDITSNQFEGMCGACYYEELVKDEEARGRIYPKSNNALVNDTQERGAVC